MNNVLYLQVSTSDLAKQSASADENGPILTWAAVMNRKNLQPFYDAWQRAVKSHDAAIVADPKTGAKQSFRANGKLYTFFLNEAAKATEDFYNKTGVHVRPDINAIVLTPQGPGCQKRVQQAAAVPPDPFSAGELSLKVSDLVCTSNDYTLRATIEAKISRREIMENWPGIDPENLTAPIYNVLLPAFDKVDDSFRDIARDHLTDVLTAQSGVSAELKAAAHNEVTQRLKNSLSFILGMANGQIGFHVRAGETVIDVDDEGPGCHARLGEPKPQ